VNLVAPLPAVLSGLVLFLGPGLLALALLRPPDREALAWDERLFLAVALSVAAASWVGLVLAEAGRFSLPGAAGVVGLTVSALAAARWKTLRWPLVLPRGAGQAAPALAVLAVALALQARPTEYLLGGRDPGTYVAAMAVIGRTGGIAYVDPAVRSIPADDVELFYRNPGAADYTWGRFMGFPLERPQTGRVVPEFFHLFPVFGAYLFQAMGVKGALAAPPVFGILGTLGVFLALRRLLGAPPALLGALLLAVNVVQVWFARYPVTETASQLLVFVALLLVWHWEETRSTAFAAMAGAVFGPHRQRPAAGADRRLPAVPLGAPRPALAPGVGLPDPALAARLPRVRARRLLVAQVPAGGGHAALLEPAVVGVAGRCGPAGRGRAAGARAGTTAGRSPRRPMGDAARGGGGRHRAPRPLPVLRAARAVGLGGRRRQ
jgi:hypothetical protein